MQDSQPKASRRGFFLTASAAGAALASATWIKPPASAPVTELAPVPPPDRGGGYSLSEHVKRYYKTTRI